MELALHFRMDKILKILLICAVLILGCENQDLVTQEIQYQDKVVVQAELVSNTYFEGVRITRTLPVGTSFAIEKAEIKNAYVYLRKNFVQIIPLHYQANGIYKPLYDLYINEGEFYEVFGTADEKQFYAKTKIPLSPQIESANINLNGYFATAIVQTQGEECYAALWTVDDGIFKTAEDFFEVVNPAVSGTGNSVQVRTAQYPIEYQSNAYNGKRYIKVFAFDKSFSKYFYTKSGSQTINNPYVQGVGETDWNIDGENVIGMFIGLSNGTLTLVN